MEVEVLPPDLDRAIAALCPVADLETRLAGKGISAARLLAVHGIAVVDGFFSAVALERALNGALVSAEAARVPEVVEQNPVAVLRDLLAPAGIYIRTPQKKRGWHLTVTAPERRLIHTEEFVDEPGYHDEAIGEAPVKARLYFVKTRHSGGAYFVASGVEGPGAVPLHFFLLLSERKVWVAPANVLAAFAQHARAKRPDNNLECVRFKPSEQEGGALRVWFPKGHSSFDLSMQVRDEHGKQLAGVVASQIAASWLSGSPP